MIEIVTNRFSKARDVGTLCEMIQLRDKLEIQVSTRTAHGE